MRRNSNAEITYCFFFASYSLSVPTVELSQFFRDAAVREFEFSQRLQDFKDDMDFSHRLLTLELAGFPQLVSHGLIDATNKFAFNRFFSICDFLAEGEQKEQYLRQKAIAEAKVQAQFLYKAMTVGLKYSLWSHVFHEVTLDEVKHFRVKKMEFPADIARYIAAFLAFTEEELVQLFDRAQPLACRLHQQSHQQNIFFKPVSRVGLIEASPLAEAERALGAAAAF